jgi:hypothetical protein
MHPDEARIERLYLRKALREAQRAQRELVTVWPKDIAKAPPVWHSQ